MVFGSPKMEFNASEVVQDRTVNNEHAFDLFNLTDKKGSPLYFALVVDTNGVVKPSDIEDAKNKFADIYTNCFGGDEKTAQMALSSMQNLDESEVKSELNALLLKADKTADVVSLGAQYKPAA